MKFRLINFYPVESGKEKRYFGKINHHSRPADETFVGWLTKNRLYEQYPFTLHYCIVNFFYTLY